MERIEITEDGSDKVTWNMGCYIIVSSTTLYYCSRFYTLWSSQLCRNV